MLLSFSLLVYTLFLLEWNGKGGRKLFSRIPNKKPGKKRTTNESKPGKIYPDENDGYPPLILFLGLIILYYSRAGIDFLKDLTN